MAGRIERLSSYEQVVAAADGDPHARWGLDPAQPVRAAARDGAVAWAVRREHYEGTAWLTALGPPRAVAALVTDLVTDDAGPLEALPRGITVPHDSLALLPVSVRPPEVGDWTWWWTDVPPPVQPGEELVVDLPAARTEVHDELVALLLEASPAASAAPDDPGVRTWCGIRSDGLLVSAGADRPYVHGVAHLASIATRPVARGRGYGGAVTAWLTRRRIVEDEAAVVTLGMYSQNGTARSVYQRLGFHAEHRFTSGRLPRVDAR